VRLGAIAAALAGALLLGAPARLAAQEAATVPLDVALAQDTGEPLALLARDVGFVVATGGDDFRLLCTRALDTSANGPLHVVAPGAGRLLVGSYRGLQSLDLNACSWPFPDPQLEGTLIIDLWLQDGAVLALIDGDDGHQVFRSDDGGLSFAPAVELPADASFFRVRFAPGDPSRVYALATAPDGDAGVSAFLFSSDDGGASYQRHALEFAEGEGGAQLLAVDAADPDRVYVGFQSALTSHSHGDEAGHEGAVSDQVFASANGGQSFELARNVGLLGALATGDEAGELWIGDAEGGLYHSPNYGAAFETVDSELHVSCLAQRDGVLWVCADSTRDRFSLGYSEDGGESFVSALRFDEVDELLQCADSERVSSCAPVLQNWRFWHPSAGSTAQDAGSAGPSPDAAPPGHGDGTRDASADDGGAVAVASEADSDSGCGCSTLTAQGATGGAPLLLALAWLRRRQRFPGR
jgi:uncharacterized protein (TIGR03382 family)